MQATDPAQSPWGIVFFQAETWEKAWRESGEPAGQVISWEGGEYPNGEQWVKLLTESADDWPVIQVVARFVAPNSATASSLAEQTWRLLLLLEVLRRHSTQLRLYLPYLPYSLQDRDVHGGDAVAAATFIRALEASGVDLVQVVDVHSPKDLEYFQGPVLHLSAEERLAQAVKSQLSTAALALVAPDKGAAHRAHRLGKILDVPVTYLQKRRLSPGQVEIDLDTLKELSADHVLLVDDLLNTGGTLIAAAQAIREQLGAKVSVLVTHGLFARDPWSPLAAAGIDTIFLTDSYAYEQPDQLPLKIELVSVADLWRM